MMIVASARQLAGERVCFVGVGPPNIACNLAKRTVAPDLELVYEAGVFGATGAMEVESLHPGVTTEDLRENTGWEMRIPMDIEQTTPPTEEELTLIREELDPEGAYSR